MALSVGVVAVKILMKSLEIDVYVMSKGDKNIQSESISFHRHYAVGCNWFLYWKMQRCAKLLLRHLWFSRKLVIFLCYLFVWKSCLFITSLFLIHFCGPCLSLHECTNTDTKFQLLPQLLLVNFWRFQKSLYGVSVYLAEDTSLFTVFQLRITCG